MRNRAVAFVNRDEVLEIHRVLLQRFGGPEGVRDPGLLESALYRSRTGYHVDLAEMAAALFESLIMNHPFVDGNKPVAFFATDVFLRLNGYKLQVDAYKAHRFLIGLLENNQCNFEQLLPWIRENTIELQGSPTCNMVSNPGIRSK